MTLRITDAAIPDVKILEAGAVEDAYGFVASPFDRELFAAHGLASDFVQDSESLSGPKGTLRGMHYQSPPAAQAKLVRCLAGAILDVVVDIRHGSPTFGGHVAVELSAANRRLLFVPIGFAHGFLTLFDDTEVAYKLSGYYSPEHDSGIAFDDPALGIGWGIALKDAVTSEKDARHPRLADAPVHFTYG